MTLLLIGARIGNSQSNRLNDVPVEQKIKYTERGNPIDSTIHTLNKKTTTGLYRW